MTLTVNIATMAAYQQIQLPIGMSSMRFLISSILSAALLLSQTGAITQRLGDVRKVFVASLGAADGADLIREKIITRLVKSGRLTVVATPEDADAVLTGIGETSKGVRYSANSSANGGTASGGTTYNANLVVRLVGKSREILWTEEFTPRVFGSRSVSSNVADSMVKKLVKAIDAEKGKN